MHLGEIQGREGGGIAASPGKKAPHLRGIAQFVVLHQSSLRSDGLPRDLQQSRAPRGVIHFDRCFNGGYDEIERPDRTPGGHLIRDPIDVGNGPVLAPRGSYSHIRLYDELWLKSKDQHPPAIGSARLQPFRKVDDIFSGLLVKKHISIDGGRFVRVVCTPYWPCFHYGSRPRKRTGGLTPADNQANADRRDGPARRPLQPQLRHLTHVCQPALT